MLSHRLAGFYRERLFGVLRNLGISRIENKIVAILSSTRKMGSPALVVLNF
jgi:hypothetical protein